MARAYTNFAKSTLNTSINAAAVSVTVDAGDGALFPAAGAGTTFDCVIFNTSGVKEVVSCTSRTGDVLTIVRGQEGSAAVAWNAGDGIGHRLTAAALNNILFADDLQDNSPTWCGTATGTANALILSPTPAITGYAAGQKFMFKSSASPNTGAATVVVSGLAATAIQNSGSALVAGDIEASKWYEVLYDGAAFQLRKFSLSIYTGLLTTTGDIIYASAARTPARLAAGASGYVLTSGGAGVAPAWAPSVASIPMDSLFGCTLANNATDATNDIDVTVGSRRDVLDTENMILTTALTKQLDAAWAVGTAAGMMDTGSIANGTWHIHAIKRTDTGVVDVIASLSPDTNSTITVTIATPGVVTWTDHGLIAGASVTFTTTGALPTGIVAGTTYFVIAAGLGANSFQIAATQGGAAINTTGSQSGVHTGQAQPVMPANYTKFRRIGSILRESATIVGFVQDGNEFWRKGVIESFDAVVVPITAVTRVLNVPVSVRVKAIFSSMHVNSGVAQAFTYFSDLSLNDAAPAVAALPGASVSYSTTDPTIAGGPFAIWTNRSASIRSRNSQASDVLRIYTLGWIDPRGANK